jgi:hypothetical protein
MTSLALSSAQLITIGMIQSKSLTYVLTYFNLL